MVESTFIYVYIFWEPPEIYNVLATNYLQKYNKKVFVEGKEGILRLSHMIIYIELSIRIQ